MTAAWWRRVLATAVLGCGTAACGGGGNAPTAPSTPPPEDPGQEQRGPGVRVVFQPPDAPWAPVVLADGVAGRDNASAFFGEDVGVEFPVRLFPDRASIDAYWGRIWRDPSFRSECWMIASGDAAGVLMLSPGVWAGASCGHDGTNAAHRRGVVFHEVVHVHHARRNAAWPSLGSLWWFVEGIAVHASGQHDGPQHARVRGVLASGGGPRQLADVLPAGYDFAGSLVAWIDRRHGRDRLRGLLAETSVAGLLQRLESNEQDVVAAWRRDVVAGD